MPKFIREQAPGKDKPVVRCPGCKTDFYGDPPAAGDTCPECGHAFKGPKG